MKRILLTLIFAIVACVSQAREIYSLNDDWQFFYKHDMSSDNARVVSLPHTWNLDALAGQGTYLQTTANYSRSIFVPSEWSGKRLFIKFHGVQTIADLFVNGHHVGEHRGGWTAFTFEITKHIEYGQNNSLVVVVNNAYQNDVLPTSSDENLYGGIYRLAPLTTKALIIGILWIVTGAFFVIGGIVDVVCVVLHNKPTVLVD
jgi:beta-galactosidase